MREWLPHPAQRCILILEQTKLVQIYKNNCEAMDESWFLYENIHAHLFCRDAPKWKFLAEAEQNETLRFKATEGRIRFFKNVGLFWFFFYYCIN